MKADTKYSKYYATAHLRSGMKGRSVTSGIFTLCSQAGLLVLGIVRGAVLARLLTPEDYGLQGMLLAVISFALMYKDLGLATATIQEKEITHQQVSNLFWINTGMGLLSALVVVGLGPVLALFYREPRLMGMAFLLAPSYLLGGMTAQPQALLQRQMRFGTLAMINLGAAVLSAGVSVLLAWYGYRYWSLVWMILANNIIIFILLVITTRWVPTTFRRGAGSFKMVRSGGYITVLNVFGTLCKNLDSVLLGRMVGTVALGIYSRGLMVLGLVETQLRMALSGVALPALSSVQEDCDRFWNYYRKFLSALAFLSMPVAVFLFVFADKIIDWYLGAKWGAVVPYLRVFSVGALISPVMLSLDRIPLALGNSRQYMWTGILGGGVKVLAITVGAVGWGAMGCAKAIVISNYVLWVPYFIVATLRTPIRGINYVRALIAPLGITLPTGVLLWSLRVYLGFSESLMLTICEMSLGIVLFVLLFVLVDVLRLGTDLNFVRSAKQRIIDGIRKTCAC
jgi:PST family polysaccharide transporter